MDFAPEKIGSALRYYGGGSGARNDPETACPKSKKIGLFGHGHPLTKIIISQFSAKNQQNPNSDILTGFSYSVWRPLVQFDFRSLLPPRPHV
jgi:hypothetical protein